MPLRELVEEAFLGWLDARGGRSALRRAAVDLVVRAASWEFFAPIRPEPATIAVHTERVGTTSITLAFTVRCAADVVAAATVTYVCVRGGRTVPLPAHLGVPV
ncbi:acyl-CoA thioesterase domain-containing protein [Nonomuraea sp. NPDC050310]|uniref:acyl-CoA thioesterase domain-containing protein n=1 Tax=unclassified Nonomuraea TaxID=2593643 RepID=UPI0033CA0EC3